MQIEVTGRKMELGAALQTHATGQIEAMTEKYFSRSLEAHVIFTRQGHRFHAEILLHVRRDIHMQSHAEADNAHAAFDLAADKVEKQLRRYKRRLKDRHEKALREEEQEEALLAQAYILAPEEEAAEEEAESAENDQPIIIAETQLTIPTLTVSDAVMMMDLTEQPALLFRNRRHGQFNMVYRRSDGNVGWIDPDSAKAAAGDIHSKAD